jgi:hypothetical protein
MYFMHVPPSVSVSNDECPDRHSGRKSLDERPPRSNLRQHRRCWVTLLNTAPLGVTGWRPDSARDPRQLPTVFRMLPKCASMWLIRPLVMTYSAVIGGASVRHTSSRTPGERFWDKPVTSDHHA